MVRGSGASIPIAILAGSALIAVAVYLGLSGRGDGRETTTPEASAPAPGNAEPARSRRPPDDRPVVRKASQAEIEDLTREAFERARPLMLERCWNPTVTANPEPATSKYSVDVTFDGTTGRAIALGISELRGEPSRPDVAQCLRELPMDQAIDPPGENARVQLTLAFP